MCIARIQRYICFAAFVGSIGKLYFRNLGGNMSCSAGMVLPLRGYIFDTSDPPKDLKQTVEDCWSVILVFQALLADYLWCHMHL